MNEMPCLKNVVIFFQTIIGGSYTEIKFSKK